MFKSLFTFSALFLAILPNGVLACEGECIVGITNAFLTNYTRPLGKVFTQLADDINTKLIPPTSRPKDPISLILPLIKAYANVSYDSLETAIFPSYFHGKCQRFSEDGSQPPGCPNPDCPVVCGTPGSLVHFYSKLRYIAFNDIQKLLNTLVQPQSKPFKQVLNIVDNLCNAGETSLQKRIRGGSVPSVRVYDDARADVDSNNSTVSSSGYGYLTATGARSDSYLFARSECSANAKHLADILKRASALLEEACGGNANDGAHGLPKCSWKEQMTKLILSYP